MWLVVIYWLLGLPSLLFHALVSLAVVISVLCYKISRNSQAVLAAPLSTCCRRQAVGLSQAEFKQRLEALMQQVQFVGRRGSRRSRSREPEAAPPSPAGRARGQAALLAALWLAAWLAAVAPANGLEQDAQILAPVAELAKAVIRTATLGAPLEVGFNPSGLVKNYAYFTWRTGFPVTMPGGFMQKVQDFYNRVRFRVNQADVKDVERKSLGALRVDLDAIVDAIVEQVRQSRDGLYTDYLQTKVAGVPLEDACTGVGVQLKAYGVDLANYRSIAGAVLGIPVMPTVASAVVDVAGFARPNLSRLSNFTQHHLPPLGANFLSQLPNGAYNSVGTMLGPIDSLRRQLDPAGVVAGPLGSIFNQAFRERNGPPAAGAGPASEALRMAEPVY